MAYSKSRARVEFETGSKSLTLLARTISYKSSALSYEHKLMIYQSSIFLLSAKIEEYTKTLIEDIFFKYRSQNALLTAIPNNIKTKTLVDYQFSHYKNFNYNADERKLLDKLSIDKSVYSLINGLNVNNALNASIIIATNKYPSVKNLKILYHRIGISDIFTEIAKRARRDFIPLLDSFLSIREAIAHQGAPPITFVDLKRQFENIIDLINYIDRIVYSHIISSSGQDYW